MKEGLNKFIMGIVLVRKKFIMSIIQAKKEKEKVIVL